MVPLRQATVTNIAREVTHCLIYHGCPNQIISDNETQLASKQFRDLVNNFGIKHRITPVYTPHCNLVKRANRTVKTIIAQYVGQDHRNWDKRIPALQFTINIASHETTGYTLAYLNHGRELTRLHPADRSKIEDQTSPENRRKQLEDAFELIKIQLARSLQRQVPHSSSLTQPSYRASSAARSAKLTPDLTVGL